MSLVKSNHRLLLGFYMSAFCESRDMDDFMQEFVSYGQHNPYMPGVEAVQQELARINVGGLKSEWNYNVMYRWSDYSDACPGKTVENFLPLSHSVFLGPHGLHPRI